MFLFLKEYMKNLITPYYEFVGFNEPPNDETLKILGRSNSVNWACRLSVDECVTKAKEQYADWLGRPSNEE